KINAGKDLPAVKLGDSTIAQVGDWVLAIGSPFGLDQTVTAGIISQVGRQTPYATSFQRFIQTDAAINRGNSGGPLVNMRGEVVGINSQIATSTGDYNGIGFALPSNEVNYVYNQILQNGKVRRGFLGVTLDSVKTEFAKVYGLSEAKGAIVVALQDEKGAAAIAGLLENDIIVQFNNQTIENAQDLIAKVASTTPNQKVQVIYLREINGNLEKRSTQLTLGERPNLLNEKAVKLKTEKTTPSSLPQLGLTLTELTPQLITSNNLGNQTGLLVKEVNPNGIIADVKLQGRGSAVTKNDLITRINKIPVKTNAEFGAIINKFKAGDAVVLHVARYDAPGKRIVTRIVQFTFQ
ncbi:MAG: PDZ domain-containing protein, partial [Pyrinomonadaceae bacterium]|nr:PDZ domain-containing protein [Pyrinomonadaceae bacterium]